MRKDKDEIITLRRQGKSYREIMAIHRVPSSTLSEWFHGQPWSNDIALKLAEGVRGIHIVRLKELNRIRGENLNKLYEQARSEAKLEFEKLKYHPLFISGLMIYLGEGDKRNKGRIGVANSDPQVIRIFIRFLREICGAPPNRTKIWLLLYPDLSESVCRRYWMGQTSFNSENFVKSIFINGKHSVNKLSYGVCNIYFGSRYLKEKMLIWLNLMTKDLVDF